MPHIVFTTCDEWPTISTSDAFVADELLARGHTVAGVPWTASFEQFAGADLIVLRANWDYHHRPADFVRWLDAVDRQRIRIQNSSSLVRWNLNKRYLLDLGVRGIRTPVTEIVPLSHAALAEAYGRHGWSRAVLKPAYGASGYLVECVERHALADWVRTQHQAGSRGEWVVQEFVDQIRDAGETSLVFIDGQYSHAIRKLPSPGEFRTNPAHGGRVERTHPPRPIVDEARRSLAGLAAVPLYARVDGVVLSDDALCVSEVELNEPALYFDHAPEQAIGLARAIEARLT